MVRAAYKSKSFVGSIPSVPTLVLVLFPRSRIKLYSHCSSLPSCINGNLVLAREAAHPAVTSMGTWEANVKLLSMSW